MFAYIRGFRLMVSPLKYSFLKSYFSFSIGTWINAIISFFAVPVTSWLMNPSDYGKGNMFLVMYSLMLLILLLGTPSALMRLYHARGDRERLLWSSLIVPIVLGIVFTFLAMMFRQQLNAFLVGHESSDAYLILVLSVFLGVFQTFFQSDRDKNAG